MCHRHLPWLLVVAGVGLSCLRAAPAAACGACVCDELETWSSQFGETQVPRNARLLVPVASGESAAIRARGGSALSVEIEPSGADGLVWVRASEPLRAGGSYIVEITDQTGAVTPRLDFSVGSGSDELPLQIEGVGIHASQSSPTCDLQAAAQLTVQSIRDDEQPGRRVIAQLDVSSSNGTQRVFLPLYAYTQQQQAEIGAFEKSLQPTCIYARAVAQTDPAERFSARVTFYDLGGHATAIAEPIEFSFGAVNGGACGPIEPAQPTDAGAPRDEDAGSSITPVPAAPASRDPQRDPQPALAGHGGSVASTGPAAGDGRAGPGAMASQSGNPENPSSQPMAAGSGTVAARSAAGAAPAMPAADGGGCRVSQRARPLDALAWVGALTLWVRRRLKRAPRLGTRA